MTPPQRTERRATPRESSAGRFQRTRRFNAARMDPKAYLGLHATLGFVGAALALWLFGALLDAVLDDATLVRWDMAAAAAVHGRATAAGLRLFDVVTQLGSPAAMGLLGAVGVVVLWHRGLRTMLVAWLAAFGGGLLLDQALKLSVHRNRPQYGAAYLHGHSYSFPSGHAMGSTIGYGVLAYVLVSLWTPLRSRRALAYGVAALLAILVGLSRVYLGVHYPSDVVGGWAAGAAWLTVCLTGAGIARRRAETRAEEATAATKG
jgi:undecaprenyl-diphosphatase